MEAMRKRGLNLVPVDARAQGEWQKLVDSILTEGARQHRAGRRPRRGPALPRRVPQGAPGRTRPLKPTAFLARLEHGTLIAVLALAALIPLIDFLGRPLGNLHVPGGAAYLQQLVLWTAFLGGLLTTGAGKHLTLSTTEFLGSGRLRAWLGSATTLLSAGVCLVLAYASVKVVQANREEVKLLPGLGVPTWLSECVMPVALALMALRFAWRTGPRPAARVAGLALLAVASLPLLAALGLLPGAAEAAFQPLADRLAGSPWPFGLALVGSILMGTPIFVAMGGLALLLFFKDGTPVAAVTAEVYRLMSSPTLPAIPLLTACGYVLAAGHASSRLLRFFRALLGWLPGGLAVIVALVCAAVHDLHRRLGRDHHRAGRPGLPDAAQGRVSRGLLPRPGDRLRQPGPALPAQPAGHPLQRGGQRRRDRGAGR